MHPQDFTAPDGRWFPRTTVKLPQSQRQCHMGVFQRSHPAYPSTSNLL